jgi:Flp pilus assembly protein TadD
MSFVACLFTSSLLLGAEFAGAQDIDKSQANNCCDLSLSCNKLARSTKEGAELLSVLASDNSAVSYSRLGQFFFEAGEFDCATSTFQAAVNKDPQLWEARYGLGLAFIQKSDANKAVEQLRAVAQLRLQDPMAHNALGLALEALGDYDASAGNSRQR